MLCHCGKTGRIHVQHAKNTAGCCDKIARALTNVEKKKHGPHALRHSLAGLLFQKKTPLPVISEVLGHGSAETTKSYLRIDMQQLRQCALEVPPVDESYYLRTGVVSHV